MIVLVTRPNDYYLIPLIDAKRHIRVDADFDDSVIYGLILIAQDFVERKTGKAVFLSDYKYFPDNGVLDYDFRNNPCIISGGVSGTVNVGQNKITVRKGVVTELVSITTYDTDGTPTVETLTDYTFNTFDQYTDIIRKDGTAFPVGTRTYNPLEVVFKAGYTEGTLPLDLKQAMLELIALWYENREGVTPGSLSEVPHSIKAILKRHKLVTV